MLDFFTDCRPRRSFFIKPIPEAQTVRSLSSLTVLGYFSNFLSKIAVHAGAVFLPFGLPQRMGLYEARNLRRQYGGDVSGRLDFLRRGRRRGALQRGAFAWGFRAGFYQHDLIRRSPIAPRISGFQSPIFNLRGQTAQNPHASMQEASRIMRGAGLKCAGLRVSVSFSAAASPDLLFRALPCKVPDTGRGPGPRYL